MRIIIFSVIQILCLNSVLAGEKGIPDIISITVKDQSATYRSNENLMIERMLDGRWLCSHRSADDRFPIGQPAGYEVFYLKIGDQVLSDGWKFISIKKCSPADNNSQEVIIKLPS